MELAAPNMIKSDFREMRELLADYAQRNEVAERSEMNLRFHNMLYKTCGNGQLLFMIQDLQAKLGQYMRLIVSTVSGLKRPIREHDEILYTCEHGDVDTAVSTLREHIETTQIEVAAFLRRGV